MGQWREFGFDLKKNGWTRISASSPQVCEQAGTGMRMMREEWQKLGHPVPTYNNDRA